MISRILVPMDDSEMAGRALEYALENHPDADVTVLHVVGEPSPMGGAVASLAFEESLEKAADRRAQEVFERARDIAAEHDTEVTTEAHIGNPKRAILNRAGDFDLVVVGSHGGTVADRLYVGNVAQKVYKRSPVPVTVVR